MTFDIFLIIDTIEDKLPSGYYDLIGILNHFDVIKSKMIISSSNKVIPQVPEKCHDLDILNILNDKFKHPNPHAFLYEILSILNDSKPQYICLPHTMRGCQIAAGLAVSLNTSVVSGVDAVIKKENQVVFKKSVMNGKWITETAPLNYPVIFTINQGAFSAQEEIYIDIDEDNISYETIEICDESYTSLNIISMDEDDNSSIEYAEVVVGAGRGAEDEDVTDLIHKFAKIFKNGGVGASRPLCDTGIFPYSHQIGETGKIISPKLYIACGVSGSNQHIAGVRQAQEIIAINKDPQAAIFNVADIGVVAHLEDLLPLIIEAL